MLRGPEVVIALNISEGVLKRLRQGWLECAAIRLHRRRDGRYEFHMKNPGRTGLWLPDVATVKQIPGGGENG